MLANGPIPPGLVVRHRCDNPPCVNPDHLEIGTQADNQADMAIRGRSKWGGVHGEATPNAKLTNEAVKEARRLRAQGWTQLALAHRFGVSVRAIQLMLSGRTWKRVE